MSTPIELVAEKFKSGHYMTVIVNTVTTIYDQRCFLPYHKLDYNGNKIFT